MPRGLTMGQFVYVVRKRLVLPPEKAMFLFIGKTLPTTGALMSECYNAYKDPGDGFLYCEYMSESTFGC